MIISPVGPRAALENDPLHRFIDEVEKDKNRLEQDRLLYVACTRARRSLHLVGSVSVSDDGEEMKMPTAGSLLARLWPVLETDFERAFAAAGGVSNVEDAGRGEQFVLPRLRRLSGEWINPNRRRSLAAMPAIRRRPKGSRNPLNTTGSVQPPAMPAQSFIDGCNASAMVL